MALEPDQLTFLRQLVSEPDDTGGWTDARFEDLVPGATQPNGTVDIRLLAALVWDAKAADVAELVNVSEAGSSRSQAQVFDHYVEMSKRYRASAGTPATDPAPRPRSTKIVRPVRG